MNNLFFLLGSAQQAGPQPLEPDPHEPYHIVFNYQVAASDRANYVFPSELPNHVDKVKALEPHSDYPPQPEHPYIHFLDGSILPGFGAKTPFPGTKEGPKMVVPNINKIAHPDRRDKLPKAFQMRIGYEGSGVFPECLIFKYNLNATGTDYVGLRGRADAIDGSVILQLEYTIAGVSGLSQTFATGWQLDSTESANINFVIWDDRLELYTGAPGTLRLDLDLPGPLAIYGNVGLGILYPAMRSHPGVDNLTFSDLLIYDAYL